MLNPFLRTINSAADRRIGRFAAASLTVFLLTAASAGCGPGGWGNDEGNDSTVPFTPQAPADSVSVGIKAGGAGSLQSSGGDPQVAAGSETLTAKDSQDAGQDPASGSRLGDTRPLGGDALASGSHTQGWYWVVGSIQSGEIGIAVNGTPIGRYSVHVDKEITAFCHTGLNTLTFTHYPLVGSSGPQCPAHLEIVRANAPAGSPPLMVYDTTAYGAGPSPAAQPTGSAQDSSDEGVLSPTSADPAGDADTAGVMGDAAPLQSPVSSPDSPSAAPYADERTFSGV